VVRATQGRYKGEEGEEDDEGGGNDILLVGFPVLRTAHMRCFARAHCRPGSGRDDYEEDSDMDVRNAAHGAAT
jgi:hypothetical protein